MSVETGHDASGAIERYRIRVQQPTSAAKHRAPGYDELVGADGVHSEDEALARAIDALGDAGLRTRAALAQRFVRSDGITFGSTADGGQARNWRIDPLPVILSGEDWQPLEAGLNQRAAVLDAVLRDAYGSRKLLRDGTIPPAVLLGHPGFVRQADGIRLPSAHQLVMLACDVARDADGRWIAFGDRADAPWGAGYAMATRRIVSRTLSSVHRETSTARLRGFFHTVRAAVLDAAQRPEHDGNPPRVVVLSGGAESRTFFDQAFLATLLGFPLVAGEDLAMRDGRVWLRAPGDDQPVDVVLRRVDSSWADPLELRSGSSLGVPGLIDAARRQQVSVVNPIGSGILENPGLIRFLPEAARKILDQDLSLQGPQTWWCGLDAERSHVLSRMSELVIKPIGETGEEGAPKTVLGWRATAMEREELAARITAEPWAWAAQEALPASTAPTVDGAEIEPRRLVLRTFGVAHPQGYTFMPGALGRVADAAGADVVSAEDGATAKDVWVLVDREQVGRPWSTPDREFVGTSARPGALAPRIADDLFWFGRYTERVEFTARLLKVADDLTDDFASRPGSLGAIAMSSVQHAVTMFTGIPPQPTKDDGSLDFSLEDRWRTDPGGHLVDLVTGVRPGSLAYNIQRLEQTAQRVRDQLSVDTWPVLSRLERTVAEGHAETSLQDLLESVLESALALSGIVQQSMMRDSGWAFVDAGIRLERALSTTDLMRATLAIERSPVMEGQIVEAVLSVGESVITHRRQTAAGIGPSVPLQSALQLLALAPDNPRSVSFQLSRFAEDATQFGDGKLAAEAREAAAFLAEADVEALGATQREELQLFLGQARAQLVSLSASIGAHHFRRRPARGTQPTEWTVGPRGGGQRQTMGGMTQQQGSAAQRQQGAR
ncbi:circularly permuted type 2 ATP-grasp protein [Dermacoccaceae bacterium W4C1]